MPSDVPITRETVGIYQPSTAQYSQLPAHVQAELSKGLIDISEQTAQQAQKNYVIGLSLNMKKDLARIEEENLGNEGSMEASFQKFREGYLDKVDDDEHKLLLQEQFDSETMPMIRRAKEAGRARVDGETETNGLMLVANARENLSKNLGGLFSKDPGAVYDAKRNMDMQAASIKQISDLTKADGTPMFTPSQRAAMLEIPKASVSDAAALAWSQRPDAQKLSIVESAMKPGGQPKDMGADLVKPFTPEKIKGVQALVDKPSPYDDIFKEAAATYGVDWQDLKTRAAVESGLDPKAVGPKTKNGQSAGIMQLTEDTAKGLGVKDRLDPRESIMGGAKLLAQHQQDAGGDPKNVDRLYYGGSDTKKWGKNTEQYAENMASLRRGGTAETGTEFDHLSPAMKAKAFEDTRDAVNINAMKFAAPAERKAIMDASGSDRVIAANVKIQQALTEDPASYVAASPEVMQAFADFQATGKPEAYGAYINASMAKQKAMGVPDYAQKILPKPQAEAIVGDVLNSFSQQQNVHEKMQALQQQYGAMWPRAFHELQAAKLPSSAMVLGTMSYETQRPYGAILSQAISEGADAVYTAAGPTAKKDIDKAIKGGVLDDFRTATQRMQGGTQIINSFTDATGILAAKMMQTDGLDAGTAVQRAAGVLVNDFYSYEGTYRVPTPHDPTLVGGAAQDVLDTLDNVAFTSKDELDAMHYKLSTQAFGYWVNTPEEDGIMLKDAAGSYVKKKDGGFVRYSFDELEQLAKKKSQARQAESDAAMKLRNANRGAPQ